MTDTAKARLTTLLRPTPRRSRSMSWPTLATRAPVVLVRRDGEDVPMALTMPSVRSFARRVFVGTVRRARIAPQSWGNWMRRTRHPGAMGLKRFVGRLAVEHIAAASSGRVAMPAITTVRRSIFILAGIAAALPGASKITARLTTMLPVSLWHLAPSG